MPFSTSVISSRLRVHLDRVADPVLGPVDAGERRHHGAGVVPSYGRDVRREVDPREVLPAGDRHALVDRVVAGRGAELGVAIARVVLGAWPARGRCRAGRRRCRPGTLDRRLRAGSPASGPRRSSRTSGPTGCRAPRRRRARTPTADRSPGSPRRPRARSARPASGPGRAEADVVREDRCPVQVPVTVHGVDAVQDRDLQPGLQRTLPGTCRPCPPKPAGVLGVGTEPPPDRTAPSIKVVTCAGSPVTAPRSAMRHLADLLLQRHAAQKVIDPAPDRVRGVEIRRTLHERRGSAGRNGGCRDQRQEQHADRDEHERTGSHGVLQLETITAGSSRPKRVPPVC